MLAVRVLAVVLLVVAAAAPEARAGVQLYKGSWIAESFGNDVAGGGAGATESRYFSVFGMPQGLQCNYYAPRCPLSETPVDGNKDFDPLGNFCIDISNFPPGVRPSKGGTASTISGMRTPPFYRNPAFFSSAGAPNTTSCTAYSTVAGANITTTPMGAYNCVSGCATTFLTTDDPLRGKVMKGAPLTGSGAATTTGPDPYAFKFGAALATPGPQHGMRRTTLGEFNNIPPYLYSYTYATLRNDKGTFAAGSGFFSTGAAASTLMFPYTAGGSTVASIKVNRGTNRFGGVMKLLGKLTTKVCYFYAGGCSLGGADWLYQEIGAYAYKAGGVVTAPAITTANFIYYNTALATSSTLTVIGERFPWTTGNITLTATGRGPHKTLQKRHGADNRVSGIGTVQLVSPILTHWLGATEFETGGIAIMKIEFLPEPSVIIGLVAGLSLLGVAYRARR